MSTRQRGQRWPSAWGPGQQRLSERRTPLGSLLLLLGGLVLAGGWTTSHAEHTAALHWMAGYRNAEGVGCCAEHDCLPWPVPLVQRTLPFR